MNIYELADINQNEAKDLELKIMNSLNLKDFSNKEHKLIHKLAGADLLTSSITRALVLLYTNRVMNTEWEEPNE